MKRPSLAIRIAGDVDAEKLAAGRNPDAITAAWMRPPYDVLARNSSRIVAEILGVSRVVYDITNKSSVTVERE